MGATRTNLKRLVCLRDITNEENFRVLHQLAHHVGPNESHLLTAYDERTTNILLES